MCSPASVRAEMGSVEEAVWRADLEPDSHLGQVGLQQWHIEQQGLPQEEQPAARAAAAGAGAAGLLEYAGAVAFDRAAYPPYRPRKVRGWPRAPQGHPPAPALTPATDAYAGAHSQGLPHHGRAYRRLRALRHGARRRRRRRGGVRCDARRHGARAAAERAGGAGRVQQAWPRSRQSRGARSTRGGSRQSRGARSTHGGSRQSRGARSTRGLLRRGR